MSQADNYSARRLTVDGIEVIRLSDQARKVDVSVVPSIGNIAYEIKVNGTNVLYFPAKNLTSFRDHPDLSGVPLLAPWANRLDQLAFYANGKRYQLNPDLGNIGFDGNHLPIHGLLTYSTLWQVIEATADGSSAHVTSRLEFWKHPELMHQFPFAHVIEMTYRLSNGEVQVETVLHNLSADPMPVSIGFHPYFQLHDAPRDDWSVHLSAREHVVLSDLLIPTGKTNPMDLPDPLVLRNRQLDDVFTGLIRNSDGRAEFWVQGKNQRITVLYGPKYTVAVSYAPPGREFICFEPMSAVTDALNLSHAGIYKDLQSVPPGGEWRESFWIRPSGF